MNERKTEFGKSAKSVSSPLASKPGLNRPARAAFARAALLGCAVISNGCSKDDFGSHTSMQVSHEEATPDSGSAYSISLKLRDTSSFNASVDGLGASVKMVDTLCRNNQLEYSHDVTLTGPDGKTLLSQRYGMNAPDSVVSGDSYDVVYGKGGNLTVRFKQSPDAGQPVQVLDSATMRAVTWDCIN